MSDRTENQWVVLVTGASAGLGLAIASQFARSGHQVVMVGRSVERLRLAADSIKCSTPPILFACDVTSAIQTRQLADDLSQQLGRLDILVNNVGTSDRGVIESLDADHLKDLLQANLFSSLQTIQSLLPLLKASRGQVVNIGSLAQSAAAIFGRLRKLRNMPWLTTPATAS
ncbi:MAG: SDR family NAD(P)-dependent oxidoreductase [Pirellulaceae bacterium]